MKTVVVNASNSTPVLYGTNNRGDGLDLSGQYGDVMVEIPRFYTCSTYAKGNFSYWISPVPQDALHYTVAPMFNQRGVGTDAGTPAPYYYVGRFDANLVGNTLQSATGKTPAVSITLGTARTYAENKGAGWGITNIWTLSALRQLFYTEMVTLNSQTAWTGSRGIVDTGAASASGADGINNAIFTINATGSGTGTNGYTPVSYRGIENLWGNVWQFQDGFNAFKTPGTTNVINATGLGLTGQNTNFKDLLDENDSQSVGGLVIVTDTSNGEYQTNLLNTDIARPLFLPSQSGGAGSETTYLSDKLWSPTSTTATPNILFSGGAWYDKGGAGDGSMVVDNYATFSHAAVGARLEFRKSPAPVAGFGSTNISIATNTSSPGWEGTTPFVLQFTDLSTNSPASWSWARSNLTSPSWTVFNTSQNARDTFWTGNWSVNLTAANSGGRNVSYKTLWVNVSPQVPAPVSGFTVNTTVGAAPLAVQFTDMSTNAPTGWRWNATNVAGNNTPFTFSTVQSPSSVFGVGNFSIKLNATNANGFNVSSQATFVNVSSSAPVLLGILPSSGFNTTATSVTITGTGFDTTIGPMFNLTRAGYANITLTDPMVPGSAGPGSVMRVIPSGVIAGVWNLTAINPDGQEGTNASVTFTVTAPTPAPTLLSVSPVTGFNTSATEIVITGSGFNTTTAPAVNLSRSGYSNITLSGSISSSTSFAAVVPEHLVAGAWNMTVINPDRREATNASVTFTVTAPAPAPTVTGITPSTGSNSTTTSVTVTGTGFNTTTGPAVRLNRAGFSNVSLTSVIASSPTTVMGIVPVGAASGVWNVYVVNPDLQEGALANGFTVTAPLPAPTVTGITPSTGLNTSSISITNLAGTNFQTGASVFFTPVLAHPVHKGSITNGTGGAMLKAARSVYVAGDYAYVASYASNALEIVDVTDPSLPRHKGMIVDGQDGAALNNPISVFVSGNYAYVTTTGSQALEIVDISNPASPRHKGKIVNGDGGAALLYPASVFVSGNYAYVSDSNFDALEIVNVTDPAAPRHEGLISGTTGGAALVGAVDVKVAGNYAYVASGGSQALEIVDVTNKSGPVHKGKLVNGGSVLLNDPRGVFVAGNYAYVVSENGNTLEIVNVTNPADPKHAGSLADGTNGALLDSPMSVFVSGNTAYIASEKSQALEIVDISNPADPKHKGSLVNGGSALLQDPRSVFVSGRYAYVTSTLWDDALEIVDTGTIPGTGVNVLSSSQITCTANLTGTIAGSYNVVVTNPDGQSAALADGFAVSSRMPAPTVTGISPPTGVNSTSTAVTITGTGFNTTTDPTAILTRSGYTSVPLTGVRAGSATSLTGTIPSHVPAGAWNVTVTNPDGQPGTLVNGFLITSTTPLPVAAFNAVPTSGTLPLSVQFTDTSTGTPTSWAWFFGNQNYTQAWTRVNPWSLWPGRYGHSSVAMPDGRIILSGGYNASVNFNDTWMSVNGGAGWTQQSSSPGWTARWGHASVAMPDGSIVLMGGFTGDRGLNDVWISDDYGAAWMLVNASPGWSGRYGHQSVVMPDGSIVLFGGSDGKGNLNDVWRSADSGYTWSLVNGSAGWPERYSHSGVVMPDGGIVLSGGSGDSGSLKDIWVSHDSGAKWARVNDSAWPTGRYGHSSIAMPDGSILVMGGSNGATSLGDVWRSADNGAIWTLVNASPGWSARFALATVALPDGRIVLAGGQNNDGMSLSDVWQLMPVSSSEKSPEYTYTNPGNYSVALQAYNSGGAGSIRKTNYINVTAPAPAPVAGFTTSRTSGLAPLTVQFNDTSTGAPVSWAWNATNVMGNNTPFTFSTLQDPSTLFGAGNYSIKLNVTNANGFNVSAQTTFINVTAPAPVLTGIIPPTGLNTTATPVTITGSGFSTSPAPAVNLSRAGYTTVPLTGVSAASATLLSGTVPAGVVAGSWNVTVINANGKEATNASVTFTAAAPSPAPILLDIEPAFGLNTSTTLVTITGTGFNTTIEPTVNLTRTGYANITLMEVLASPPTLTTLTRVVPEGIIPGTWNVVIINPDHQEAVNASVMFNVTARIPAPVVMGITPPSGVNSTTTAVTITGTGFNTTTGSEVRLNRAGFSNVSLTGVSKTSSTTLTATVPAGVVSGAWNVFVVNPDQQEGLLANGFTVTAPIPAPVVTGVTPPSGVNSTTTAVTITGTGFNTTVGSEVRLNRAGFSNVSLTGVSKTSSTTLTATVPAGVVSGAWNVFVVNPDQQEGSLINAFTVTAPIPAPVVTGVTPPSGVNSTTTAVTITGTGFNTTTGSEVRLNRAGFSNVSLTGVSKTSSTTLTATVPSGAVSGAWNVFVVNPDQQEGSLANGFTVTAPIPAPVVMGITPPSGVNSTTTAVTITGTGFNTTTGSEVRLNRAGFSNVSLTGVSKTSSTTLTATVPAGVVSGAWNVFVVNPDQQEGSLLNAFTVYAPVPAPVVTGISPSAGINTTATVVTVTGTGFNTTVGSDVRLNKAGYSNVTLTGVVTTSSTSITGTVPAGVVSGMWNVFVVNPDRQEGSLASGYQVYSPISAPVVTGISPSAGINSTATVVTVTGTGFNTTVGSDVRLNKAGYSNVTLTGVVTTSSTTITGTVPAGVVSGVWDVFVVNPDRQEGSLANGYTVYAPVPAPEVLGISPVTGLNTTATVVTITGREFNVTTPGVNLTRTGYASVPLTGVTRTSSTSLTGTVPLHVMVGAWTVAVTNPDGQTGTNASVIFTSASPGPVPVADFTLTPVTGIRPLMVTFTDRSTNSPTSWLWDFGDGGRSTSQNPSHTYTVIGVYDVTLSATNAIGTGSVTRIRNISVTTPVNQSPANYEGVTLMNSTRNDFLFNITDVRNSGGSVSNLSTSVVDYQPVGWHRIVVTGTNVSNNSAYIYADQVNHVSMTTLPYREIIVGVGTAESQFTLEQSTLVKGAAFGRDVVPGGNNTIFNLFQQQVPTQQLNLGYTLEVTGEDAFNTNLSGSQPVFINLSASHTWVLAHGGTGAIRIFHLPDTAIPEVLPTTYVGGDGTTDYFSARAGSLSIFGLGGVTTIPVPTPVPTQIGGTGDDGGGSSSKSAAGQPAMKAPLQQPLTTVSVNVGQVGRTSILRVDVTGVEVRDMIVTATEVSGPGTGIPPPPGIVYEYADISPARFTEITDSKINFYVPVSWITGHNLVPGDIVLYHNVGKTWEALPTTLDTVKDGRAYYTAAGSGFSRFAITGQINHSVTAQNTSAKTVQTYGAPVQTTGTQRVYPSRTKAAPLVTSTTPVPAPLPDAGFPVIPAIIGIVVVVLLIGGGYLVRRWWIRRQNPALFRDYD